MPSPEPFSLQQEREQAREAALAELRALVSQAEVGSPTFIAFSDYTDHLAAKMDRDHSLTSLITYEDTKAAKQQMEGENFSPHYEDVLAQDMRIAETHYALVTRDIESNRARLPGYYQAAQTMRQLGDILMTTNPSLKGDDYLTETLDIFQEIREAAYQRGEPPQ